MTRIDETPTALPHSRADTPRTADRAARSLARAVDALFAKQRDDGHWCAELEGDSILNSEYLLMKVALGQDRAPSATPADERRFEKMCAYLRMLQRADGTWGQYPGAPADLSACVKSYFALKLWGDDPGAEHMRRAREAILAMGGAERINTFSMFYLACLGQVSWDACPSIPPEIALLPRWFPFHMDKVAAWTRTMILPLAICTALRPVRAVPEDRGVAELFIDLSRRNRLCKDRDRDDPTSLTNVFITIDALLKAAQRRGWTPGRTRALRAAEAWIVDRMRPETTDGLGAIFPPMVYVQVAFQALGYARTHPVIQYCERELDRFIIEEKDHVRIQPCFSPVWDTGIALYAMTEAGRTAANDGRIARCCEWLRAREVRLTGDWARNLRPHDRGVRLGVDGAAWAFEYRNDWYPDVDDTAMVAKALRRAGDGGSGGSGGASSASARAVRWIVAMQNDDGGWAAFDRTKDRPWMEKVPFADHNAMQDPSCADITGRTVEALITCGVARDHPTVRRAVDFLHNEQSEDGSWRGRWGVNYLYGTWQAVGGLVAAGEDPRSARLQRALAWVRSVQNDDGGFGETADSYLDESRKGRGPSTASQTAWGAATLMFLVGARDEAVERAIDWLCATQLDVDAPPSTPRELDGVFDGFLTHDAPARASHPVREPAGAWREPWFTGTGFPRVFYLRYHLYRHYFPVMALARYLNLVRIGR